MTKFLKAWLSSRGITAMHIAEKLNMKPHHLYGELRGRYTVSPALHDVLINVYGMTEDEYVLAVESSAHHGRSHNRIMK